MKRVRTIHIWQFPNNEKILVKLNKSFVLKIGENIIKPLLTKRGYFKLTHLIDLCKMLKIPLLKMEKNIVAYKVGNGSKLIVNPKLPLTIDPIFDMVLAHHCFDGYIRGNDVGGYKQIKDRLLRENFKLKLKNILGEIKTRASEKECIFIPRFLVRIFKQIYNLRTFGSFTNRLPELFMKKNKFYKVAILTAAIGDEGSVDSNKIIIYSANKSLLQDLCKITKSLKYQHKIITRKTRKNAYELRIFSLSKFYEDFLKLVNRYPFLTLGEKEKWLKFYTNKNKRKWWRRKAGETKQLIINLLLKQPMSLRISKLD